MPCTLHSAHLKSDKLVFIDDYAHHPTEIKAFFNSVRSLYPGKKITAVFQPHLFTRTRDFVNEFAESLDLADEVILMNIYPARELPIEGVTSELLIDRMQIPNKILVDDQDLQDAISKTESDVFLTVGAGDIDRFVLPIKEMLEERI